MQLDAAKYLFKTTTIKNFKSYTRFNTILIYKTHARIPEPLFYLTKFHNLV